LAKEKEKTTLKTSAEKKVSAAIKALAAVATLQRFSPTAKQADSITNSLKKAVELMDVQLRRPKGKAETLFRLPD
jgi:hypothetical protein